MMDGRLKERKIEKGIEYEEMKKLGESVGIDDLIFFIRRISEMDANIDAIF